MNNRTRYVPALIMLAAGFIACVSMIVHNYTTKEIILISTAVMVVFLIVGFIVRFVMDTFIFVKEPEEEENQEGEEDAENKENDNEDHKEDKKEKNDKSDKKDKE